MGKELRRVPLDFNAPLNKAWEGYINPYDKHCHKCDACDGTGYSPEAKRFRDEWYGYVPFDAAAYGSKPLAIDHPSIREFATRNVDRETGSYYTRHAQSLGFTIDGRSSSRDIVIAVEVLRLYSMWRDQWCHQLSQDDVQALLDADRLWDFTSLPRTPEQMESYKKYQEDGSSYWLPEPTGYVPTADEVNAWSFQGMGHDAINAGVCIKARCVREGVDSTCPVCDGSGHVWDSPETKAAAEVWEKTDPPTGEGFQLWCNTGDDMPISPVFKTLDRLCRWAETNAYTFGYNRASAQEWRTMLDGGIVHHREGNMVFM